MLVVEPGGYHADFDLKVEPSRIGIIRLGSVTPGNRKRNGPSLHGRSTSWSSIEPGQF
jgi:hypothetical protein